MDAAEIADLWEEAWGQWIDTTPWSNLLENLTPAQAAWRPATDRKSIWAIVLHVASWREIVIRRGEGNPPSEAETEALNWPAVPVRADDAAWAAARARWESSCRAFVAAIRAGVVQPKRAANLLQHDQYHAGQVMYLRAMQGLPPMM